MAISFGPKLGLLYNALIGESYFDSLRIFLQSLDALVQGSVINATQAAPPSAPNGGDAYLLTGGTPSGAWTGQAGNIAVWDAQLTNSGTNTVVPGWIFLSPKAGWTIWNVAASNLIVFNGTSWNAFASGANFPTNTNITSMTGIPNTNINATGYAFNDGTDTVTTVGGPAGFQLGTGTFGAVSTAQMATQAWAGTGYTGIGIGVSSASEFSIMYPGTIATSGEVIGNNVNSIGLATLQSLRVGDNSGSSITSNAANVPVTVRAESATTNLNTVIIDSGSGVSPTPHVGLLGFTTYNTQTTVGAAGGASALPATPTGYLPITIEVSGTPTEFVIPYYAHA